MKREYILSIIFLFGTSLVAQSTISINEEYLLNMINKEYKSIKKELEFNGFEIVEDKDYNFNHPTIHVSKDSKPIFSISTVEDGSIITGFAVLSKQIKMLKYAYSGQTISDFKIHFPSIKLCIDEMSGGENFYHNTTDSVRKMKLLYAFELDIPNGKEIGKYPVDDFCTLDYLTIGSINYIQVFIQY